MRSPIDTTTGAASSGVSILAYIISKATDIEVLQYLSLVIGVVTGFLTAILLILNIVAKIRDSRKPQRLTTEEDNQ